MIGIPNRPFATEPLTGMMLPDGFFEASIGLQGINAHFQNAGATAVDVKLYFESASHPAFLVTPETFEIAGLAGGAQYLASWQADVSGVPPGVYLVSFIAQTTAGQTRIIKKVFVTKVTFDGTTKTLSAAAPEGKLELVLSSVLGPNVPCSGAGAGGCGCGCAGSGIDDGRDATGQLKSEAPLANQSSTDPATLLGKLAPIIQTVLKDPGSAGCPAFYLLKDGVATVTFDPPFAGQYGELPFQDPWWKVLLIIIAVILAIAAIVVAAVVSGGTVVVAGAAVIASCCTVPLDDLIFGLLGAGAVGSGGAAGLSDVRDPFRRGEDNTVPAQGELTTSASVKFELSYPEPSITLGRPFAVTADWHYTRITTGNQYTYSVSETNTNIHVLSEYDITAPNIVRVYKREPFIVKGRFFENEKEPMRGSELYVQCILAGIGPLQGRYVRIPMQDSGIYPDAVASDGTYTGIHYFESADHGFWQIYVIAQDVNDAQPDMTPEEAAQIIGGQIRTHQLTISFAGGTCPKVPDGEVHVLSDLGS
jgi:hypothetical protein